MSSAASLSSSSSVTDLEVLDAVIQSTSVSSETSSPPTGYVEPPSAVVARYLQKATTAPPTIKHFFKPKQLEHNGERAAKTSKEELERVGEVPSDETSDKDEEDGVVLVSSDHQQSKDSVRQESAQRTTCTAGTKTTTKRSSCSKVPAAKKHRQRSIATLFSSVARTPKTMQCPICSQTFDESVSNADVNNHIDSCLME